MNTTFIIQNIAVYTEEFINSLNNREIAIIIWALLVFIIVFVHSSGFRESVRDILNVLFNKRFLLLLILMIGYSILTVYLLKLVGFWTSMMLKDTIIWMIFTSFPMALATVEYSHDKHFIKNRVIELFSITLIFQFIFNFIIFPLWAELILIMFLGMIIIWKKYGVGNPEYEEDSEKISTFIDGIIGLITIIFIITTIIILIFNFNSLINWDNLFLFLLPILLTLSFIIFMYLLAVEMRYEFFKIRLQYHNKNPKITRYLYKKVFLDCFINLSKVNFYLDELQYYKIENKKDIDKEIERIKSEIR